MNDDGSCRAASRVGVEQPANARASDLILEAQQLIRSNGMSSLSALREAKDSELRNYVIKHIMPLAEDRCKLDRLLRVLEMQERWTQHLSLSSKPSEIQQDYEIQFEELVEKFRQRQLAFYAKNYAGDEKLTLFEGFLKHFVGECDDWPTFSAQMVQVNVDAFRSILTTRINCCVQELLDLDQRQSFLASQFDSLARFSNSVITLTRSMYSVENEPVEIFCRACEVGDIAHVKLIIVRCGGRRKQQRQFVLSANSSGTTGFHIACRAGHTAVVNLLLNEFDFPPVLPDRYHQLPPVFWAVSNCSISCTEILRVLSRVNALHLWSHGRTPLHFATQCGNLSAVMELVDTYGVQLDAVEKETDRTALHLSCSLGLVGITSFLLAHGANPSVKNSLGETPLYEAFLTKRVTVVLMMARKGFLLSAMELERVAKVFDSDDEGLRLLALPHEDALRRIMATCVTQSDLTLISFHSNSRIDH